MSILILLIIDDSNEARKIADMLADARSVRYSLISASHLAAGLHLLSHQSVAAILLDLALPDSHVLDSIIEIEMQAPLVPIIALATLEQEPLAFETLHEGVSTFVIKEDLESKELDRAIRCSIEQQRRYQALLQKSSDQRTRTQREAKAQIHKMNDGLEQRVLERTFQMEVANKALEKEIRERKRIEEELRKLTRAVEQSPASIVITDTSGTIEYVNPKFTQITGYSFDEVIGQNPRVLKSGEILNEDYQVLWKTITSGREWRGEFHNRKKNGDLFWEFASISPIVNASGEITHFLAVKEDITERKEAEAELQRARQEAEAATRAKSEFLANMSHEIRTPLNAIIGMTTLLLHAHLPSDLHSYVETIRVCGDALLDIINDILDFSKIEAGKLELEHEAFTLCDCIGESFDLVAAKAAEKNLDLGYVVAENTPASLVGDAKRLRQIFANLLSNAVKFTEKGEIVVAVRCDTPAMTDITIVPTSCTLHVSVQDTGIGIPKERMDRLFHSFSQTDKTVTHRYGGTGLGLAISRRLAELMGGTMWAESAVGHGSTFHFTITVDVAAFDHPLCPRTTLLPLDGKRVLIVEDNPTIGNLLAQQVGVWGMIPSTTTTSSSSLHLARTEPPFDIAILDNNLPDTDGLQLAQDLRSLPCYHSLPILLLATVGTERTLTQPAQAYALLFKPPKPSHLSATLTHLLTNTSTTSNNQDGVSDYLHLTSHRSLSPELMSGQQHPLRILVAEDNVFNQRVIVLLLERIGYQADVVSNGRDVLNKLEQQAYDAVLMDVQMPEMDGIETTRTIRTRFSPEQQPHIIAMTAHVLMEDRNECMQAGMDDYVSKPIRLDELVKSLRNVKAQQVVLTPAPDLISPPASVDIRVLETFLRAFGENNPQELHEIIGIFLENAPTLLSAMHHAIEQQQPKHLILTAHTLKSSSAQLGARTLSQLCQRMEQAGQHDTLEEATDLMQQIEDEFGLVRNALEEILQGQRKVG